MRTARAAALAAALGLAGLLLPACPAEQLGVELPRGGPDQVRVDDVQRDAFTLARAMEGPEAAAGRAANDLAARLAEMRVLPGFGTAWVGADAGQAVVCGRKDGSDAAAWLVIAEGDPATVPGRATWAALVSLAKAFDVPGRPARTVVLCATPDRPRTEGLLGAPPVPLDDADVYLLGPVHGPTLQRAEATVGGVALTTLQAPGGERVPARVGQQTAERVVGHVQETWSVVTGQEVPAAGPPQGR